MLCEEGCTPLTRMRVHSLALLLDSALRWQHLLEVRTPNLGWCTKAMLELLGPGYSGHVTSSRTLMRLTWAFPLNIWKLHLVQNSVVQTVMDAIQQLCWLFIHFWSLFKVLVLPSMILVQGIWKTTSFNTLHPALWRDTQAWGWQLWGFTLSHGFWQWFKHTYFIWPLVAKKVFIFGAPEILMWLDCLLGFICSSVAK